MIRVCDGTDEGLRREEVNRVAASGQESVAWRPCDCGLRFDDKDRLTVYPHQFIHGNLSREERVELGRRVEELVAGGKSAEEIREWLTSQPVSATLGATPTASERSHMDEQFGTGPTGEDVADQNPGYDNEPETETVSAEGNSDTVDNENGDLADAAEAEGNDKDGN
jgi:hypothetical protein